MKKNTKTYLLIAAVLGIWGAIGYQVISGLNPNETEAKQDSFDVAFNPKTNKSIDTFSIQTVDRDPFLGTLTRKVSTTKRKGTLKQTIKDTTWLPITYNGLVKRQNSTQLVFVINISGTQHLLKKGQTINEVTLVRGTEKQIVVKYNNKQKTISIQ